MTNSFKVGELLPERKRNSKTWMNFDGTRTTQIHSHDVHFEDEFGDLKNIETDLYDEADFDSFDEPVAREGKEKFKEAKEKAKNDKKKNKMNRDNFDFQGLKVPFDVKIPRNFKKGYTIGKGQNSLTFVPQGSSPSKAYVEEGKRNIAHYPDAWNDTDVTLELTQTGIKETMILKTDRAPQSFSFEVKGQLEDDLRSGELKLQPAWLMDANGEERDVEQTIRREKNKTYVDLVADVQDLVYPIEIDPTVVVNESTIQDSYVNSMAGGNNYGDYTSLRIGNHYQNIYRSYIKFDFESQIPSGSEIKDATLFLYVDGAKPQAVYVHRLTEGFQESTITWNTKPSMESQYISGQNVEDNYSYQPVDILGLVDGVVNSNKTNYGVCLKTSDYGETHGDASDYLTPVSSEGGEPPYVEISYNVPPSKPTLTSPNGGETINADHVIEWNPSVDTQYGESSVTDISHDSGNDRSIVQLENGTYVTALLETDGSERLIFYKSSDGSNWEFVASNSNRAIDENTAWSITSIGNVVHFIMASSPVQGGFVFYISLDFNGSLPNSYPMIESGTTKYLATNNEQNSVKSVAITRNIEGTELHACWSAVADSHPNSKNIFYCKGTVNGVDDVTWGSVEQWTTMNNSSYDFESPSIVVRDDGKPVILLSRKSASNGNQIMALGDGLATANSYYTKRFSFAYDGGTNTQYLPSAIFIPSSVSGLANGRIWVAWHGEQGLGVSYSDDGGETWTYSQLSTNTGYIRASMGATNGNDVFVIVQGSNVGSTNLRRFYLNDGGTVWGGPAPIGDNDAINPSVFFDPTFQTDFPYYQPWVVYQNPNDGNKVRFRSPIGTPQENLQYQVQLTLDNGGSWNTIQALSPQGATTFDYQGWINEPSTSTAKVRVRAYDGSTYGEWDESNGVFTIQHNQAPTTPTNLSPSSGAYDRGSIIRLEWQHNDDDGDPQAQFELRWRVQGGSWNYVNEVTVNEYYDLPSSTLPKGNIEFQVKTYDQEGLSSPYSSLVSFYSGDKPSTPTITSPSDQGTVSIANPVISWSSVGQTRYDLIVEDSQGNNVFQLTPPSTNKAQTITYDLENESSYTIKLAIQNSDNLWSDYAKIGINVSYTQPSDPTIVTTKDSQTGSISLNVQYPEPSGTEPSVTSSDVFKKIDDNWVRIATGVTNFYTDYTPKNGVTYQYKIRAFGSNGTYVDSESVSDSVNFGGVHIHLVDNPIDTVYKFKRDTEGRGRTRDKKGVFLELSGREFPVYENGKRKDDSYTVSLQLFDGTNDYIALQELYESEGIICVRDGRSRRVFGILNDFTEEDETGYVKTTLTITRVDYYEEV